MRSFLTTAGIGFRGSSRRSRFIELPNGSHILALTSHKEANIRGFTPDLVIMDEAARIKDDVYHAITPMLGLNDPTLVLLSTPYATRGFFYEEWISSEPWDRFFAPTAECPRYDKAHIEAERRTKPEHVFRR